MTAPRHQIGYCTNVHAGPTLAATQANLERYALAVKELVSPSQPLGVGLWLAAPAAEELTQQGCEQFRDWLASVGLVPFTFNGFPYGDFHGDVVKHRVYHPTWWEPARLEYTLRLIDIQHILLPAGQRGSISTLPIAWSSPQPTPDQLQQAAAQLHVVARHLQRLHDTTGREIILSLEPEPGCYLQRADDVIAFFENYLFRGPDEPIARRFLGVCHDVCHSVVMFEPQTVALRTYAAYGIRVGKTQISSAVVTPFPSLNSAERTAALEQLRGFHEPRYLHQTCVAQRDSSPLFFEDLHLASADVREPDTEWRTHFHVPVYLEKFGLLRASQEAILECVDELQRTSACDHWEVETYAWGVLPPDLQVPDLATGIAREVQWFAEKLLAISG